VFPALITRVGERDSWRYVEFFTGNNRNKNTRAAYSRAAGVFLSRCEGRGIRELVQVQPIHVASYVEELRGTCSAPTVKHYLACIRMLFDWLVSGQIVGSNPAHAVRGPRHSVAKGKTPVLTSEEASALLEGMDVSAVGGLRDLAIIAVMTYTFAHVGAVVGLKIQDHYVRKRHAMLRLHEKNGKVNRMPCHPKLAVYLDEYLDAEGVAGDRKDNPLFRSVRGKTKTLTSSPLSREDVWRMVRRRAVDAGIETPIGCHTFPTGITDYLTHNWRTEVAQKMPENSSARTTGLYDRRGDGIDLSDVA
jgi:integrase/recombinase XerD